MNIFVITACYNYEGKLEKYIESFNASFEHSSIKDVNFRFMFVNDQPGTNLKLEKIVKGLVKSPRVKYSTHHNSENLGVTLSRNWAARAIFRVFGKSLTPKDLIIYFDSDDTWTIDAVEILSGLRDVDSEFIFLPVSSPQREINKGIAGDMELGQFCTYVPMQECIYCWRVGYAYRFMRQFGWLWYEDKNKCKYYPEDIMFHCNPKHHCYVIPDAVICDRDYDKGNITNRWDDIIRENKPAFEVLEKFHRRDMHNYKYPDELIKYVNYLAGIVYEDSDNK